MPTNQYGQTEWDSDPETASELIKLKRQQAIADALMQRGQQPLQGQMVGNHYVAPSITQGLAQLFNAYSGRKASEGVEEGYKTLASNRKAMEDSERGKIIEVLSGRPAQPMGPPTETGDMGVNPAVPAGNREQIMRAMLQSKLPEYRKTAESMLIKDKTAVPESPWAKVDPKDYTPESLTAFSLSKNPADLRAVGAAASKLPSPVQEYQFAKAEGYKGDFTQWKKDNARAGASSTTVHLPAQEKGFETELGKEQAKGLIKGREAADDAVQIINTVDEGRKIMAKGMVTGFGANAIVGIGQALKQAGIDFGGDATANAQAYTANMAQNVGKIIKQFGAGTGLSDADREYATKMAGGLITIDEKAINKILDINERAARSIIKLHNRRSKDIKTNVPLTVDEPPTTSIIAPPPGFTINKQK